MSTVAYRAGVLAGDLKVTNGSRTNEQMCIKVAKAHGCLFGGVGNPYHLAQFFAWARDGLRPDSIPTFMVADGEEPFESDFIWVGRDGTVHLSDNVYFPLSIETHVEFCAIGSGASAAMGAMTVGVDACHAVEASMQRDVYTGIGVGYVTLDGDPDDVPTIVLANYVPLEFPKNVKKAKAK